MKYKRIIVFGGQGQLSKEFEEVLSQEDITFMTPRQSQVDISDYNCVINLFDSFKPDLIINCAAYTDVDGAEDNPKLAFSVNCDAVGNLADLCLEKDVFLVHYGSDYVFDGKKGDFYTEQDMPNPLSLYGESKLAGEKVIEEKMKNYLIFRLSWVIGEGSSNFLHKLNQWVAKKETLQISDDEVSIPTFTDDIVHFTLMSLERKLTGLYHLVSSGQASRFDLSKRYCEGMGFENNIVPVSKDTFKTKAERPQFSCLSNKKISKDLGVEMPSWEKGMKRFIKRAKGYVDESF